MYHIYYVTLVRVVFSVQFAVIRGSRQGVPERGDSAWECAIQSLNSYR